MKERLNNLKKLFFLLFTNVTLFFYKITHIVSADEVCKVKEKGKNSSANAQCSYGGGYLPEQLGGASIPPNKHAYIAQYVKYWDFTYMNICDVFWNFARVLVIILNELHNGITGLYKSLGLLFSNTSFTTYFDSYNVLIGPIITVVLFFYALYVMFFGVKKLSGMKKGLIMFFFMCIFGSSVISMLANASGDLTETSFSSANNCKKMSMGTCIAKNYIIDIPYYASQNNKNGAKNDISNDYNFYLINFKDSIGPMEGNNGVNKFDRGYDKSVGDLNVPTFMDENGVPIEAVGLKDGDWFKANTDYVSYARYYVNLWGLIPVLILMIFAIVGTGFITGLEVFNGLIISGLLPILSAVDIGTGEKTAKAFKMLGMIFANIFLYSIVISFYSVFINYVTGMQIHWLSQLFLIGGASVGLFNLRSLISKVFGIEKPQDSNMLQRLYYGSRMFGAGKRAISGAVNKSAGVVLGGASLSAKGMNLLSGGALGRQYDDTMKKIKDKWSDFSNRNRMDYTKSSSRPKSGTAEYDDYMKKLNAEQDAIRDDFIVQDAVNFINDDNNTRDEKQLRYLEYEQAQKRIIERNKEKTAPIKNLGGYNFGGEKDGTVKRDLMNRPVYVKNEKPTYSNPVRKEKQSNQSKYNDMNKREFNNKKPLPHQNMVDFDNVPSKAPLSDQELQDFLNEYGDVLKK